MILILLELEFCGSLFR